MKGAHTVKEIQIKNFRSLKDTGLQKVTPITLLVGGNSSGKSSFLRSFPLLKQSISRRTAGPILWAGDADDYVDFGSFEETVTNDKSDNIVFRFRFETEILGRFGRLMGRSLLTEEKNENTLKSEIDYQIFIKSDNGKDYVSRFAISINNTQYDFNLLENKIIVNGRALQNDIELIEDAVSPKQRFHSTVYEAYSRSFGFTLPSIRSLWNKIYEFFPADEQGARDTFAIHQVIDAIGFQLSLDNSLEYSHHFNRGGAVELYQNLCSKIQSEETLQDILRTCYLYSVFSEIDEYIELYYRQVHYIAPLRATAERYYRLRNFAVDEVDFQGKNLAVFINSLSEKQLRDFNKWTQNHFGFYVSTDKSKGHLSLLIRVKDSPKAINLSDTGFGYSQVLPIITQLWVLSTKARDKNSLYYDVDADIPVVVAIEQPELHLHPAVQAKLAKAFIASIELAKKNGYQLRILLETHSETIINYLGREIARGKLNKEDVSVILFEKENYAGFTSVRNSGYDQDGFLENWPYGFFAAEE